MPISRRGKGFTPSGRRVIRRGSAPLRMMGGAMRRARGFSGAVPRALGALAAVHAFKRVGAPMVIHNTTDAAVGIGQGGGTAGMCNFGTASGSFLSGTQQVGFGMVFRLSQAAVTTDLTSLFDNYRIKKVVLRFNPLINSAPGDNTALTGGTSPLSINALPMLHVAPDFDDSNAPTAIETVLQNSYAKSYRLDKPFTITLTPRAQSVVTATGATTAGGLAPAGQWFDCQSPDIDHHGLKMWLNHFPINAVRRTCGIEITPVYYLEFKNVN